MILYVRTSLRYYDMTSVRSTWHTTIMEQRIIWSHVDLGSWHSSFIWVMWKKVSQEIIHWYWSLINWLRYFMIIRISDIVYNVINSVFIHSFMYSLICSLSDSFTHTLIYSLTHSLIPSPWLFSPWHDTGGETNFPTLGIAVKPKKGRALLWPSTLDADPTEIDSRTMHEVSTSYLILSSAYLLNDTLLPLSFLHPILFISVSVITLIPILHFAYLCTNFSLIFFIYFSLIFFLRLNLFWRARNSPQIAGFIYTILLNRIYGVAQGLLMSCKGGGNVKNNRTSFLYVFSAICTDMIWVVWGTLCESAFSTSVASDIKIWCTDSGSRVCGLDCSAPCVVDRILHIKL